MKAVAFEYVRVATVDEATKLLAAHDGEARVIAGGQSLVPMLNLRLARPSMLVDITGLKELTGIDVTATETVIGALVTHAALEAATEQGSLFDMLRHVAGGIAYRGVRNRGTIGGSVAHADPAADWLSCLLTLDAKVEIAGTGGRRIVPIGEFTVSSFTTVLQPDEFVVKLRLPAANAISRWGYYKHCRKVGEFAEAIGCVVEMGHTRRIVAGALPSMPVLLSIDGSVALSDVGIEQLRVEIRNAVPILDEIHVNVHAASVQRAILGSASR